MTAINGLYKDKKREMNALDLHSNFHDDTGHHASQKFVNQALFHSTFPISILTISSDC